MNEVINDLDPHATADNYPALQGGRERQGSRFEFFQDNWSPAARFLAGALGGALAAYGGKRRNALGARHRLPASLRASDRAARDCPPEKRHGDWRSTAATNS